MTARVGDRILDGVMEAYVRAGGASPLPTGEVADGVTAVRTGPVNLFVVAKGPDMIAIDAGFGPLAVRRELARAGVDPRGIGHVFLTHSDFDHAGGLAAFDHARVALSRDELGLITRRIPRRFGIIHNSPITRPHRFLHDGDRVRVGSIDVVAIAAPGHTPGSMAYLVDGWALFVGDAFKLVDDRAAPLRPLWSMDKVAEAASIAKLGALDGVRAVFTAHSGFAGPDALAS
jgi:glyoxylase-like metal-dependent hydrolase (beta-lactamase superfamily II)